MDNPSRDVAGLRDRDGQLSGRVELGVGCGRDAICAAGAGGRSHAADCRVLSGADYLDGGDGVGMGGCGVGGDEVFSACEYFGGGYLGPFFFPFLFFLLLLIPWC